MSTQDKRIVIWRFTDGRPGHDTQSLGLVTALSKFTSCEIYDIKADASLPTLAGFLKNKSTEGQQLPKPNLLVGAGRRTHLPLLMAKKFYGGITVILMRPSLPMKWFDLCLIPEHDHTSSRTNVLNTKGAVNTIYPYATKFEHRGLILIGGPSKYFSWDDKALSIMINTIISRYTHTWDLVGSPRTPDETQQLFTRYDFSKCEPKTYIETDREWVEDQIHVASKIWVTEDSSSMLYEAITSGAAVGVLPVPAKRPNKISQSVCSLVQNRYCTWYTDWVAGQELRPPQITLDEASRCARYVLEHIYK